MKKLIIIALSILIASPAMFAQTKAGKKDTQQHTTFYSCPMHTDATSDQAGKCPKCGMDLVLSSKEQMKKDVMKNYTCPVHFEITKHDPGKCPQCGKKLNLSPKEQMKAEVTKIHTCPMHQSVALDKNGICSKCEIAILESF